MFNISALKEMKLAELQEIAKLAKTIKVSGAKKETLIAEIIAHQEKGDVITSFLKDPMNGNSLAHLELKVDRI